MESAVTPRGRQKTNQYRASIVATVGMICLLLVPADSALGLDPGDGTMVGTEQLREPKVRDAGADKPSKPKDLPGEKADLSVYQVFGMNFGTLVQNDGYIVLGTGDTVIQDPDHLVYGGMPQSAEIRLNGDPFVSVTFDITAGVASGFTLSHFETDYGTPPLSGLTLDATGNLTLRVGARLRLLSSGVSTGNGQQVGYTISAVYE